MRSIIVNADDFGQSPGVNRGIVEAHEGGIVTSTSLMVRWPAAREAAAYACGNVNLSVGLHLDFGEWIYRNAEWVPLYTVVHSEHPDIVMAEAWRQLDIFRDLVGRDPAHIDSHQHVHKRGPFRDAALQIGDKLGIAPRHFSTEIGYCGDFYGQTADGRPLFDAIRPQALVRLLESLPQGITELACHPAKPADLDTMYREEREVEFETLCHPLVRGAIDRFGIHMLSGRVV